MKIELFGLALSVTIGNVVFAFVLTLVLFGVTRFIMLMKELQPYKKDRLANDAYLFIFTLTNEFPDGLELKKKEKHQEELSIIYRIGEVFDVRKMQNESYRMFVKDTLKEHVEPLRECYHIYRDIEKRRATEDSEELLIKKILDIFHSMNKDLEKQYLEDAS